MASIRSGGRTLKLDNEGYYLFLAGRQAVPALGRVLASDQPDHSELRAQGGALRFEVCQDDPVRLELHLGAPLTRAEAQIGKWQQVRCARLGVSGGSVVLVNGSGQSSRGLKVPPGEYTATLYQRPLSLLTLAVLTPSEELPPPVGPDPWIGQLSPEPWIPLLRSYLLENGHFRGHKLGRNVVNLDLSAYQRMNLRAGTLLEVALELAEDDASHRLQLARDSPGTTMVNRRVEFLAQVHPAGAPAWFKPGYNDVHAEDWEPGESADSDLVYLAHLDACWPPYAYEFFPPDIPPSRPPMLRIVHPVLEMAEFPLRPQEHRVEIRVLRGPEWSVGECRVDEGSIHGFSYGGDSSHLVLNLDIDHLRAGGFEEGQLLRLEVGGRTLTLPFFGLTCATTPSTDIYAWEVEHWDDPDRRVFRVDFEQRDGRALEVGAPFRLAG